MTTKTITHGEADRIARACGWLDLSFRPSYSGRGMYGATCIGVTHRYSTDIAELCQELRDSGDEALASMLARGGRGDSMGLREITYWPSIAVAEGYYAEDVD